MLPVLAILSVRTPQKYLESANSKLPGCPVNPGDELIFPLDALNLKGTGGATGAPKLASSGVDDPVKNPKRLL